MTQRKMVGLLDHEYLVPVGPPYFLGPRNCYFNSMR